MTGISSQGARILIWDGIAAVTHVISAITKAKPAVVTVVSATGLLVGGIVKISGTGFKALDDMPFRISTVAVNAITLEDSDTTDEVGTATAGSADEYNLIELCLATFNVGQPAGSILDITTLCDQSRRTKPGLPGQGTWNANGFWDVSDASQLVARDFYRSGDETIIRVMFRDNSGIIFTGAFNENNIGLAIDAPISLTVGGTINGFVNRATW